VVQVDAYNGGGTASTITLACPGLRTVSVSLAAGRTMTIATGWTANCSALTVGSTNGWDTNFDNLVISSGSTTTPPTATPTTPPARTATPTPVQSGSSTVNFDNLSNPNRPLSGQYPTGVIDWGTNRWYLSGPFGQFRTQSIGFNGEGPTSASFTFVRARRLVSIDAFNGGSTTSTITLTCAGQRPVSVLLAPNTLRTITTGWTGTCTSVTVGSTNGWDTNFDNLVHSC
jgi:hypothetical protein